MSQVDSTAVALRKQNHQKDSGSDRGSTGVPPGRPAPEGGGLFKQYKPDQGKWTRLGTFVGSGGLIAWGAKFLFDRLSIYEGDEAWRLLITTGIPIAFAVLFGAFAWWITYGGRNSGDFMIATEGEMKKVSWSSKREVIGSTRVVILFTVLMAVFLFIIDLAFQTLFSNIGVLKR